MTLGPFILEGAGDEGRTVEVTEGLLEEETTDTCTVGGRS